MRKTMKKLLAVLLTLVMVSGTFVCFAAELNQEAVNEHKGQFKNYLLLGDSVASGYRDEMSENDKAFNEANNETTYSRVPGSYADVLANAIIEDKSMTAFAAPGFRTIEMRYMLEDDFAASCEDEYLFHPSQLYVYEDYGYLPGDERVREAFQNAVKEADLITLGVGGNDWGAYLGWVIDDVLDKENVGDKYMTMLQDVLDNSTMDIGSIEKLVDVAHLAGALPELVKTIPSALNYGLSNFYNNWNIMIQDIYDLNPDVTLVVLGMSDNSVKGKNYDYNGVTGEPVNADAEENSTKAQLMTTIIDFIMSVGNKPMIDGAQEFGYTYIDTYGTTYVDSHPDADGHVFIANKIIEALPHPEISKKYDDVNPAHKYYNAIEYVLLNGIMSATSETTFSPDDAITSGQLAEALNAVSGTDNATDGAEEVTVLELAISLFKAGMNKGLTGLCKGLGLSFNVISDSGFKLGASVTRGQAANYLKALNEF